ncbi:DUF2513 domain-containing protein [Azospira oryzae]|uniref:DUF2513 domain-containing protein n=1 Tax=Azospira oryzae TaxID=146939 RepID=UPI00196547A4|nr:DUF2513 domain-containing protein [Azospira oryzae]
MTRDMDLIRALLLKLEALPSEMGSIYIFYQDDDETKIPGYTYDQVWYHYKLLLEAGLVDQGGSGALNGIMFRSLTWAGHDFVDSVRDPEIWAKAKKGASAAGGLSLDLLQDLAKGFIKKQIEDLTGIKL